MVRAAAIVLLCGFFLLPGDAWKIEGDFSIPAVKDPEAFERELKRYESSGESGASYHNP